MNCREQAYDNAATMAGCYTGVQQRIKDINPNAEFVPCSNHSLNLVCVHAASVELSIIPEHRDYLRFFLPTVKETKIYRHCRVVFGICSSPFQLSACIDHLLENSPARYDDVTQKLKHSFYVDNCVTGVSDIQEQENFIVKAIEVMAKECYNLRGWESNVPGRYISRSSGVTSLLGLLWDLDKDTLKCNLNYLGRVR
ncbi:integrase catalytic domain-containing protein [Trichonephila inaurata madagascariensis]|uniref:Integrase catalytic domain-containing protein n=1 Tax=Trichonephila inaurata madagascariensis TaxID=2747483 RepID=A0A8X6X2D8_9ARAC|nr:integrase catalytic domain-containing protein [Trichonephila inaurata madagascariensis]